MSLEHEYSLLGSNRASVGRWLYVAAASVSAGIVFLLLSAVDLARAAGINRNLPPGVLSLVGAGTVYLALYTLFNQYGWKIGPVGRWLKLPDLAGKWCVEGTTLEKEPHVAWSGTITIVQSWDKLRIHLETPNSGSDSIAAALQPDEAAGYRLMYHYRNQPRLGTGDMVGHHGFAELTFAPGEHSAVGEYFNGRGRNTFGTMKLTRETS